MSSLSRVRLFATPWTVAHQAVPSMGFSRQGYWSGLPFPSPGELPDPGIEPGSPILQADTLPSEPPGKPWMVTWLVPKDTASVPALTPLYPAGLRKFSSISTPQQQLQKAVTLEEEPPSFSCLSSLNASWVTSRSYKYWFCMDLQHWIMQLR